MDLRPCYVKPVHPPRLKHVLEQLIMSMLAGGWTERPLLVEEEDQMFPFPQYFAWTGAIGSRPRVRWGWRPSRAW